MLLDKAIIRGIQPPWAGHCEDVLFNATGPSVRCWAFEMPWWQIPLLISSCVATGILLGKLL